MWPGETRVYPFMLADKQVPVLDLTNSIITSQADIDNTQMPYDSDNDTTTSNMKYE